MKRYVVVSTNNNKDYMFYAPYIEKAWNSLGWNLCVMVTSDVSKEDLKLTGQFTRVITLPDIEGLRKESIAQAGRLYAANHFTDDTMLMTSDMDLLPLSDYWNPNPNEITVYGHDLTDYTYYPMGYTAMTAGNWKRVMCMLGNTEEDMKQDAYVYQDLTTSDNWEKWWNWDWRMLTDRLTGEVNTFIKRGRQPNGFAYGRIDRGNSMKHVEGELIDAHCENNNVRHPDKLNRFLEIFETRYGKL